jgi:GDP-L-fucose synthase
MRVLVTGGNGFLGRWVCRILKTVGHSVFAPTRSEYNLLDHTAPSIMLADLRPEVVIHLAATVGGIEANRLEPGRFFYENIEMGVRLMESARIAGVKKFVQIGTVCAYPKYTPVPFSENDLWNGYPEETNAPYGIAKKALLVMAQAYRQQYGFNAIYLLPVNLYGPGDHDNLITSHVIPAMIRKFIQAKDMDSAEVVLWGTGTATREFLYVQDAAEGIVLAMELYDGAAPVNLGSGEEISIKELSIRVAQEVGFSGRIVFDSSKPDGQPRRRLDTSRAFDFFQWRAKVSFSDGLRKTVAYMRDHFSK